MSTQVKIKVRVGQTVRFPGQCVHDMTPATALMTVRQRMGRRTRLIDAPVCAACQAELGRLSGAEERQQRLGMLVTVVGGLAAAAVVWWLMPAFLLWLKLLVAIGGGGAVSAGILSWFRGRLPQAARPEKKAIRDALKITRFSWRATTFEFTNDAYAAQFASLNKTHLMET
ncbi:MAG: hypothetical protein KC418_01990 [Anaerolineales bacterium]|nr:hypothetical protein [Anaerolineales bacterium]MCB8950965.1 hypothetical protein [Ardenticatenales bacterium]